MNLSPRRPIGVFDSGLGGLTVLNQLLKQFPNERFLYFGDTARVPYGNKSASVVTEYSRQISHFLLNHGHPSRSQTAVKMMVIACNTASAMAGSLLKKELPVPVIGVVEAGARAAAMIAPQGTIAVMATRSTIQSSVYVKNLKKFAPKASVVLKACPLLVPLVEEGFIKHPVTGQIIHFYLDDIARQRPQVLVLGCTHYPILQPLIQQAMGPRTKIIDSPSAVAREVGAVLHRLHLACPQKPSSLRVKFFVTDSAKNFQTTGRHFLEGSWPGPIQLVRF